MCEKNSEPVTGGGGTSSVLSGDLLPFAAQARAEQQRRRAWAIDPACHPLERILIQINNAESDPTSHGADVVFLELFDSACEQLGLKVVEKPPEMNYEQTLDFEYTQMLRRQGLLVDGEEEEWGQTKFDPAKCPVLSEMTDVCRFLLSWRAEMERDDPVVLFILDVTRIKIAKFRPGCEFGRVFVSDAAISESSGWRIILPNGEAGPTPAQTRILETVTTLEQLTELRILDWVFEKRTLRTVFEKIAASRMKVARQAVLDYDTRRVAEYTRETTLLLDEAVLWMVITGKKFRTIQTFVSGKLFEREKAVVQLVNMLASAVAHAEGLTEKDVVRCLLAEGTGVVASPPGGGGSSVGSFEVDGARKSITAWKEIRRLHVVFEKNVMHLLSIGRPQLALAWCVLCAEEFAARPALSAVKSRHQFRRDADDIIRRRLPAETGTVLKRIVLESVLGTTVRPS